jgi:hypothetical protein
VDVTGVEEMWISMLTETRISTTTLIAASTRTRPEPELGRAERGSGNIIRNTGRELHTAIKRRHRNITGEDPLTQRDRGRPFGAVRNREGRTFPKVGQVNSAAGRVASPAPETEPGAACPVARVLNNEEGATVLLEEVKVVAKRGNRAAAGVRAVRA